MGSERKGEKKKKKTKQYTPFWNRRFPSVPAWTGSLGREVIYPLSFPLLLRLAFSSPDGTKGSVECGCCTGGACCTV
jgi:hypothetical protein